MARHVLGFGFEIQAVMAAELVGGAYFRLLRSTGDPVLRQVCELMVQDEGQHRRFHVDRVVTAWVDHRAALRAVGIDRRLFVAEARADAREWLLSRAAASPAARTGRRSSRRTTPRHG